MGERAPFVGVLVPEATYHQMWSDIFSKDLLSKELISCSDNALKKEENHSLLWFLVGIGIGAVTVRTMGDK